MKLQLFMYYVVIQFFQMDTIAKVRKQFVPRWEAFAALGLKLADFLITLYGIRFLNLKEGNKLVLGAIDTYGLPAFIFLYTFMVLFMFLLLQNGRVKNLLGKFYWFFIVTVLLLLLYPVIFNLVVIIYTIQSRG